MNTYELQEEFQQMSDLLETLADMKAAGEDVVEFEADTMAYFNTLKGSLYEKMDNIGKVIRNHESIIEARKSEAKRLTDSARALQSSVDYLKDRLLRYCLEMSGERKIVGKTFTVSFRKSSSVEVSDIDDVPFEFLKIKEVKSVDKNGLKKWISEGNETAGAKIVERESVQLK